MIRTCPHCQQKNRIPPAKLLSESARCGRCAEPLPPPDAPLDVDAATFKSITESVTAPILIDFWAGWCGPCKMAAPEVAQVARTMAGKALVLKVDTEREPGLAAQFDIRGIPNFLVLKQGQRIVQHAGLVDHRQMQRWLLQAQ
jgi:thioredoxin 2